MLRYLSSMKPIYIIVGTVQEIPAAADGTPGVPYYSKNCVRAYSTREDAEQYVRDSKLLHLRKDGALNGEVHYREGYYDMEVEESILL